MRDPRDAAVGEVIAEHVRHALRIGDEVDALSVRRVLRVDVLRVVEQRQDLDVAAADFDGGDVHAREAELLEARVAAAVGDEGDGAAVRRPCRLHVGELVAGQAAHLLRIDVVGEKVGDARVLAGDGDGVAVR